MNEALFEYAVQIVALACLTVVAAVVIHGRSSQAVSGYAEPPPVDAEGDDVLRADAFSFAERRRDDRRRAAEAAVDGYLRCNRPIDHPEEKRA